MHITHARVHARVCEANSQIYFWSKKGKVKKQMYNDDTPYGCLKVISPLSCFRGSLFKPFGAKRNT